MNILAPVETVSFVCAIALIDVAVC